MVLYDGSEFFGFQRQPAIPTIGAALEKALARVFHVATPVAAAGRTDAGVHATGQVISFVAPQRFPVDRLAIALNTILPRTISIQDVVPVCEGWSARFAARERRYVYLMHTSRERNALRARYFGFEPLPIDLDRMRVASRCLIGKHDFRSFCGIPPKNGSIRDLRELTIARLDAQTVRFEVRADGFVHRMVRIIIGTLLEIGNGYRLAESLPAILAAQDRRCAGHTAMASGLYLAGVRYADFDSFNEPWALGM